MLHYRKILELHDEGISLKESGNYFTLTELKRLLTRYLNHPSMKRYSSSEWKSRRDERRTY